MTATVLIVGYRAYAELERCLVSLREHEPHARVVVLDHAADETRGRALAAKFPQVLYLPRSQNPGFAAGVNACVAHAGEGPLLLLNPDCELTGPVLSPLGRRAGRPSARGHRRRQRGRAEWRGSAVGPAFPRCDDGRGGPHGPALPARAGESSHQAQPGAALTRRHDAGGLGHRGLHVFPARDLRRGRRLRRGLLPVPGKTRTSAGARPTRAGRRCMRQRRQSCTPPLGRRGLRPHDRCGPSTSAPCATTGSTGRGWRAAPARWSRLASPADFS